MRDAGIDYDRVGRLIGVVGEAVGRDGVCLRPGTKMLARPPRQAGINFNRDHSARGTDNCGEDRAVIAHACADVDHAFAGLQIKLVEKARPKARLSIVEPARLIDGDHHVMAEMSGIGVVGVPILATAHRAQDAPRPGPAKCSRGTVARASTTAADRTWAVWRNSSANQRRASSKCKQGRA